MINMSTLRDIYKTLYKKTFLFYLANLSNHYGDSSNDFPITI